MRLIRISSARFAPQNEYRLPQYRSPARTPRRIAYAENRITFWAGGGTLPRGLPNEVR